MKNNTALYVLTCIIMAILLVALFFDESEIRDYKANETVMQERIATLEKQNSDLNIELQAMKERAEKAEEQADERQAEQEAAYYYEETYYYEPTYDRPSTGLTREGGVNYYDGRRETYYSSNVAYHYRTSEWTLDEEGFWRTDEGYYVVAASDMEQGTTFEGSKGMCIVLDSGCAEGTTDYYVGW